MRRRRRTAALCVPNQGSIVHADSVCSISAARHACRAARRGGVGERPGRGGGPGGADRHDTGRRRHPGLGRREGAAARLSRERDGATRRADHPDQLQRHGRGPRQRLARLRLSRRLDLRQGACAVWRSSSGPTRQRPRLPLLVHHRDELAGAFAGRSQGQALRLRRHQFDQRASHALRRADAGRHRPGPRSQLPIHRQPSGDGEGGGSGSRRCRSARRERLSRDACRGHPRQEQDPGVLHLAALRRLCVGGASGRRRRDAREVRARVPGARTSRATPRCSPSCAAGSSCRRRMASTTTFAR